MRKRWGMLICFVGMDGTGKTTQAKRLVAALQAKGIKSRYGWNGYEQFLTWPLIALGQALFLQKKDAFKDYAGYSQTKRGLFKNGFLSWAYELLVLLDYLAQTMVKVVIPLMLGRTVVSDRYIYDLVVNLAVDLDYPEAKIWSIVDKLSFLLPKPDLIFFLDNPEQVSYGRKSDIPSIAHLTNRRRIYLDMARKAGATVLDGSRGLEEVESAIQGEIRQRLGVSLG